MIRVGANVGLLTRLGYAVREFDGLVYLWPARARRRRQPPMVLRLVRLVDGRNRVVCLLTDVLDADRLSDAAAGGLYRLRWGVELLYRALKQTMRRRKMLGGSPAQARVELDWSVAGLWLLALMNAKAAGTPHQRTSPAAALRVVRRAMAGRADDRGRRVRPALARCVADDGYARRGDKAARRWPHKKRDRPPGEPRARNATDEEVRLAQRLLSGRAA